MCVCRTLASTEGAVLLKKAMVTNNGPSSASALEILLESCATVSAKMFPECCFTLCDKEKKIVRSLYLQFYSTRFVV